MVHAQLSPPFCGLFLVFWLWADAELFPKSPGWGVTPKTGLESYHASTTPMDTQKDTWKKKNSGSPSGPVISFLNWQGQAAHRSMKDSTGAPCSEAGRCWVQQLGSVPTLQHSKAMIPCLCVFLGNQTDHSPTWKPAAISGMEEKLSVEHEKDFFYVLSFQRH